ncbi:hypothetical protein DFH06DRAFT_416337 [Mycena polygramma]|nr:hypothetical protein DFH06DRAFT_416337 [Mycena polygramma]
MSILLFAVLPILVSAESCIPNDSETCSTPHASPLKVFATFCALLVLLVFPFLIYAICRQRRLALPDVMPLVYVPATDAPPSRPPGPSDETEYKHPRPPPPSYSPTQAAMFIVSK